MTLEHLETLIAFAVVMLGVSLIITVLTQMASALFGLRGTNLLWGLKAMLKAVDPKLEGQAETILRDKLLSDSAFTKWDKIPGIGWLHKRWTLASAIEPKELAAKLGTIAENLKKSGDGDTADAIGKALDDLDPDVARQARLLKSVTDMAIPEVGKELDERVKEFVAAARKSAGKLEATFDTAMKRVGVRFALHMRLWTVAFAAVVVLVLHLDSLKLLEQLWSNPQMRSSLVSSRDAMLREAGTVIALPGGGEQAKADGVEPQVYTAAIAAMQEKEKDALKDLPPVPGTFPTLDEAVKWLEPKLKGDDTVKARVMQEYRIEVSNGLLKRAAKIRTQLENSGFQLIPQPYPGVFKFEGKKNVLGILASWALLSLGAPFWFNALKSLSSLRPVLAGGSAPKQQTAAN